MFNTITERYNIYNAQIELVTQEQGGRKADQLLSMYMRGIA